MIHVAFVVLRMDTGGAERCIARLASGVDPNEFRVSIICLEQSGEAAQWIQRDDVEIIELDCPPGNNMTTVRRLAECLRRIKPDIAQSHNWGTLLETHFAVRRAPGVTHLHAERGTVLGSNRCGPKQRWMRRVAMKYACRRTSGIVTNADSVAKKVADIVRIPKSSITVIPNGVDPPITEHEIQEQRSSCRQTLDVASDELIFTSVGRMVAVKNFSLAIEAFANLSQNDQQRSRLLLVGEGPYREQWESLAESKGISDRVMFVGAQQNVWPFLAASDVFLNTSHSEGMSQSLLEAMSVGVPIIATDVGDAKIIVSSPEPCGIIIPAGDRASLTEAMTRAANDREWISTMSHNAKQKHRDHYGLRTMIRLHEEYYRRMTIGVAPTDRQTTDVIMGTTQ